MVKKGLAKRRALKGCYGTSEWSENSGICKNCDWQEDCGQSDDESDDE